MNKRQKKKRNILIDHNESLEAFVKSILIEKEEFDVDIYGYIVRFTEEEPFWSIFLCCKIKQKTYYYGHYPLKITNMVDFTDTLTLFTKNKIKLIVNTDSYFYDSSDVYQEIKTMD